VALEAVAVAGDRGACVRLASHGWQRTLVRVSQEYLQQAVGGDAEHDQHDRKGVRGSEMSLETAWCLAWSLGTSLDWLTGMPALHQAVSTPVRSLPGAWEDDPYA
jgi:hypothetical protein